MDSPPSASNDEFHNFLCYDDLPGILIPQKVYLPREPRQEYGRHFATFYRQETPGATLSAGPGATLGVSLADALAFDPKVMKQVRGRRDPALAPLEGMGVYFVLQWPGCSSYTSNCTKSGRQTVWTSARLAHEVARAVHKFYELFKNHVGIPNLAPDWTPDRILFDKLYLLELRQVGEHAFQPVLYYDAN